MSYNQTRWNGECVCCGAQGENKHDMNIQGMEWGVDLWFGMLNRNTVQAKRQQFNSSRHLLGHLTMN